MWIQYTIVDGMQTGTLNHAVDPSILEIGITQIECPPEMGDATQYNVDITQNAPALILKVE